jgi:hypothetical protein
LLFKVFDLKNIFKILLLNVYAEGFMINIRTVMSCLATSCLTAFPYTDAVVQSIAENIQSSCLKTRALESRLPQNILRTLAASEVHDHVFMSHLGSLSYQFPLRLLEITNLELKNFHSTISHNIFIDAVCVVVDPAKNFSIMKLGQNPLGMHFLQAHVLQDNCLSENICNLLKLKKFDILHFSCDESICDFKRIVEKINPFLDRVFIAVVSNWHKLPIRSGFSEAFHALGFRLMKAETISQQNSNYEDSSSETLVAFIFKPYLD